MKNSSTRRPIFFTQTGTPFAFWDDADSALIIEHGPRKTFIYFHPTNDPTVTILNRKPSSMQAEYIYSNGRIVASYLPAVKMVMICRDGDIFGFDCDEPAFGYKTIKEYRHTETSANIPRFERTTRQDSAIRRKQARY